MLCPSCHGRHFVVRVGQVIPCPECGGLGEIHCCDGLAAQPESYRSTCAARTMASEEDASSVQRRAESHHHS